VIDHYLAMEKMRFGDYLCVEIRVDPTVENIVVPSLILQPLLENAIKYGTKTSPEHLDINIIVKPLDDKKISITISNTGCWVSPDNISGKGSTGIGIKNIKARLTAFYNNQYLFEHREKDGQVITCICLPNHLL
jgi:sensor histidine kinase YesM